MRGSSRALALALLICMLSSLLFGCREKKIEPNSRMFYEYFDTVSVISDYSGGSDESFASMASFFERELEKYHKLFDIYNEYEGMNNVYTVNRMAGVAPVKVDGVLIDLIQFAIRMHGLTDGNVNIAMGSVLSLWHKHREGGKTIPSEADLREAAGHTDISKVIIDTENSTVYLADPDMSLDLGSLAKGYAAQRLAQSLKEQGYDHCVIDLGGNLRAIGSKVDGSSWRTGIRNPNLYADNPYIYYLDVADTSVVTSGDYQRYYVVDGKKYHHIINNLVLY